MTECVACVQSCLENKHYELSLKICDHALHNHAKEDPCSPALDQLLFYQAKALFNIYSREQVLLHIIEKQISFQDNLKLGEDIFSKPREIAGSLGRLLTKGSLDAGAREEVEQLLDAVLIDLVREVNRESNQQVKQQAADSKVKSRTAFHCLLCHRYGPLAKGHFFPHSMLKTTQTRKDWPTLIPNSGKGGKEDKQLDARCVDTTLSTGAFQDAALTSDSSHREPEAGSVLLQEKSLLGVSSVDPKDRSITSTNVSEESHFQHQEDQGIASGGVRLLESSPTSIGRKDKELAATLNICGQGKELEAPPSIDRKIKEQEITLSIDGKGKEHKATPIDGGKGIDSDAQSVAGGKQQWKKPSSKGGKKQINSSSKSEEDLKFLVKTSSDLRKKPTLKSAAATVFYMFCDRCDNQVLSRDEKVFSEQTLAQMYSDTLPGVECLDHELDYDSALYRFCVGLVFRALAVQRGVSKCSNSVQIYRIFKQCRAVLTAEEGCGVDDDKLLPQLAIFFTPAVEPMIVVAESDEDAASMEHVLSSMQDDLPRSTPSDTMEPAARATREAATKVQSSSPPTGKPASESPSLLAYDPLASIQASGNDVDLNLIHFVTNNCFSKLGYTPLLDSCPGVIRKGHFLLVHCGVFSVVLLLEPVPFIPTKYGQFLVNPKGGLLHVPINDQRLSFIPSGVMALYRESTAMTTRNMLEVPGVLGSKGIFHDVKYIPVDRVSDSESPLPALKGMVRLPYSISLLPAQYSIDVHTNSITLPPGDRILLHFTRHPADETGIGLTVFLVVSASGGQPYALIHQFSPDSTISLGFYIDVSNEYKFQSFLSDTYPKMILDQLRKNGHSLLTLPSIILPQAMSGAGVSSYGSLLAHSLRYGALTCCKQRTQ